MRKLQEVKEEMHGSSDEEGNNETSSFHANNMGVTFNHVQGEDGSMDMDLHGLSNRFTRMFINEESIEEEEAMNAL